MRKAFNFYRSYWEVLQDIENPTEQLAYLKAILDRQFTGVEPNLQGIAKIVYNGQRHSIDKSVEGYESKTKTKLCPPTQGPTEGPTEGGTEDPMVGKIRIGPYGYGVTTEGPYKGPTVDPSVQEKEKEKEKEKEEEQELEIFSEMDVDNYVSRLLSKKGVAL